MENERERERERERNRREGRWVTLRVRVGDKENIEKRK
jgi:hypothetical protein